MNNKTSDNLPLSFNNYKKKYSSGEKDLKNKNFFDNFNKSKNNFFNEKQNFFNNLERDNCEKNVGFNSETFYFSKSSNLFNNTNKFNYDSEINKNFNITNESFNPMLSKYSNFTSFLKENVIKNKTLRLSKTKHPILCEDFIPNNMEINFNLGKDKIEKTFNATARKISKPVPIEVKMKYFKSLKKDKSKLNYK